MRLCKSWPEGVLVTTEAGCLSRTFDACVCVDSIAYSFTVRYEQIYWRVSEQSVNWYCS
jgi:hypothetical protein